MQTRVFNEGDCTRVEVHDPNTGETLHSVHLAIGQEVTVVVPNAHSVDDIEVGEVSLTPGGAAVAEDSPGEQPQEDAPSEGAPQGDGPKGASKDEPAPLGEPAPPPSEDSPDSPAGDHSEGAGEREDDDDDDQEERIEQAVS